MIDKLDSISNFVIGCCQLKNLEFRLHISLKIPSYYNLFCYKKVLHLYRFVTDEKS